MLWQPARWMRRRFRLYIISWVLLVVWGRGGTWKKGERGQLDAEAVYLWEDDRVGLEEKEDQGVDDPDVDRGEEDNRFKDEHVQRP